MSAEREFWSYGRLTGSYPETGLEEIKGDLLEADFSHASWLTSEVGAGVLVHALGEFVLQEASLSVDDGTMARRMDSSRCAW